MITISLRNLPPDIESAILELSRREGISLNRAAQRLLEKVLKRPSVNGDFEEFHGAWTAKNADRFDASLQEMRKIDPGDWNSLE